MTYGYPVGVETRSGANHRVATSIVLLLIVIWAAAGCWLIASSAWPDTTGRKEPRAACRVVVVDETDSLR